MPLTSSFSQHELRAHEVICACMPLLRSLLFCTQGSAIFWEDCTTTLMGGSGGEPPTRSRRLYDVANVLCACKLVAKVPNRARSRRPTYTFLGGASVKSHFQRVAAGGGGSSGRKGQGSSSGGGASNRQQRQQRRQQQQQG